MSNKDRFCPYDTPVFYDISDSVSRGTIPQLFRWLSNAWLIYSPPQSDCRTLFLAKLIIYFIPETLEVFKGFQITFLQVDIYISTQIIGEGNSVLVTTSCYRDHWVSYTTMYQSLLIIWLEDVMVKKPW
jgi:hypothetical protein